MDGHTNSQIIGQPDVKCTYGKAVIQTEGCIGRKQTVIQIQRQLDSPMDRWTDTQAETWMARRIGWQTDRQTNGQT
jgi:hypothetical protein